MIKWILIDQAGVQTYPIFTTQSTYSMGGKTFEASRLESIFNYKYYDNYLIGKISEEKLISSFIKDNKLDISVNDFIQVFKKDVKVIPGIKNLVQKLSKNYSLATLINEGTEWTHYKLDKSGLKPYFKHIIISGEIKVKKPDRNIYQHTIKVAKAKPSEIVFVDDMKRNITGARKLGIHGIHYTSVKMLKKDLKKLNVVF